jgi:hypothetical protein
VHNVSYAAAPAGHCDPDSRSDAVAEHLGRRAAEDEAGAAAGSPVTVAGHAALTVSASRGRSCATTTSSSSSRCRTARSGSFARNGDLPKVEVKDPREGHRKLLPTYTDKDMHDVTAFLVTLK